MDEQKDKNHMHDKIGEPKINDDLEPIPGHSLPKHPAQEKAAGTKKKPIDFSKLGRDIFKKKYLWIAIAVIFALLITIKAAINIKNVLFKKKKPDTEQMQLLGEGVPVKVYKTKRIDFKDTIPVLGTIKGYKEIPMKFQTSGIIESFNFEEGEKIQEGDIIANLEQKDALLKLKYAELEYNTSKKMFDVGAIIQDALEKSRLEYESARSDLEKTNIYAVSDGVLGMQNIDVGSYVTPNDKVGMFLDLTKVYAEFDIIEKDVQKIQLGQKVEIDIDALPTETFTGTVDVISPMIEGRTRTQRIKIELKNPESKITPGMFSRGRITTYENKNALMIPISSYKKKEDTYFVYVINREEQKEEPVKDVKKGKKGKKPKSAEEIKPESKKDMGVVEIRPIVVKYMTQDKVEVEKGLEEGELVAMDLAQDLQDKESVEIAEVQEILY